MRNLTSWVRHGAVLACMPLVVTLACHDSTNPDTADISGTYTLQSIAGVTLPYSFQPDATTTITLTSDVLTVNRDGTWTETETLQQVANGQTTTGTTSDGGTWTRSGTTVNFASQIDGSVVYVGTYSDNTLTLDAGDGLAQVFRR